MIIEPYQTEPLFTDDNLPANYFQFETSSQSDPISNPQLASDRNLLLERYSRRPISISVDWLFLQLYVVIKSETSYDIVHCNLGEMFFTYVNKVRLG